MRKWMRERAKRRKGTENTSESTGKIGQTIDHSKPAPLVPSYDPAPSGDVEQEQPEEAVAAPPTRGRRAEAKHDTRHERKREANRESEAHAQEGRMEVETQP